jgi:bifunctional aspartokinase / homoserine dehydrogenase 1
MKVLKFGGTSVANAAAIKTTAAIILEHAKNDQIVAIVSALGGVTNLLLEASKLAEIGKIDYLTIAKDLENRHLEVVSELMPADKQANINAQIKLLFNQLEDMLNGVFLIKELTPKASDFIVSFGEQLSSIIVANYAEVALLDSISLIKTNRNFGNAVVNFEFTNANIQAAVKNQNCLVAAGFVSSSELGETTTLGRGGSDYTASIYAAALNASIVEIWTDVNGMMTADPRKVPTAFPIDQISYAEAMELSHFGAKVLYPPTIQPAQLKRIPILIKNTFDTEAPGTLICENPAANLPIKGISSIEGISLLSLSGSGIIGIPGSSSRLFGALAKQKINVILITQSSSEHSISIAINEEYAELAAKAIADEFAFEIATSKIDPLKTETDLAIVALVGENMNGQAGVAGKMFGALGINGINIRAIAQGSSERNISIVIDNRNVKKALNVLHERFFASENKKLNVFVIGTGNVGGAMLEQIHNQQPSLLKNAHIDINIAGLANSRKMLIAGENGLNLARWKEDLNTMGEQFSIPQFINAIKELNLRNSVFVDITANEQVARGYDDLLRASISVVTANKIANSSEYEYYSKLKASARKNNTRFLFETNVGAGLPIIGTLKDLINSGDKIHQIQGVVSGSLNFIFNNFNEHTKFADIVKLAQTEGYTEPDPREDLSGSDIKRKIVILIRESGYKMEMDDITVENFIPQSCFDAASVDSFFEELKKYENDFQLLFAKTKSEGKKLRVIGGFDGVKAFVKLEAVGSDHPFYNLQGKDNIVLFYTDRYAQQPLVIQGAGAGAVVTAAGIFADIIRIANTD